MTCAQWIVLDNLKRGWIYTTNLNTTVAGDAYLWCVRNEYIKDGKITAAGEALLTNQRPKQ